MAVWEPAVAEELRRDVRLRAHVQGRQESATANRHRARHGCGRNRGPHQTVADFAAIGLRLPDLSRAYARRRIVSHFSSDGMGSPQQCWALPRSRERNSWMRLPHARVPCDWPYSTQKFKLRHYPRDIDHISDGLWWKTEWPELAHKLPPKKTTQG